jgi:hypothetical protein
MNMREIIATGLRFYQRVGRPLKREDLRGKRKERWESVLGFELPTEYDVRKHFGSHADYLKAMGFSNNMPDRIAQVEDASLKHVLEVYPQAQIVRSERSVYDLEIGNERVEVKGTQLAIRNDTLQAHFSWRLHKREFSKIVDRVILVGLDKDLNPLIRLEFYGAGLKLLDKKDTLTIYAAAIAGGHSKYRPYVAWIAPITKDLLNYARRSDPRKR